MGEIQANYETVGDFSKYGRVGVLYGGTSAEREVSLASGQAVIDACVRLGIDVTPVEISHQVIADIQTANIDTAFIALHGGIGEDGRLQALLDFMGIRYAGSGVQASVVAMNKLIAKQIWRDNQIETPAFAVLNDDSDLQQMLDSLGGQVIVKPAHEGSSIGMTIAKNIDELCQAYQTASQYDACVFAETLVTGGEYTVAIVNGEVLPPIKLETDHQFYDYDAKYVANDTRYLCPCGLSADKEAELKALSLNAFNRLQCSGWGRVDVMMDQQQNFYVIEVNTVPGMTSHSLVPMAAKAAGYSFDDLVAAIINGIDVMETSFSG